MAVVSKILRWTCLILALSLLIEGVALFIGMTILNPGHEWVTILNIIFLVIDILVAAGLLRLVFCQPNLGKSILLYGLLIISIITHAYRGIEYILQIQTRFLLNEALFLVNLLKLGLTLVALIIGLYLYLQLHKIAFPI